MTNRLNNQNFVLIFWKWISYLILIDPISSRHAIGKRRTPLPTLEIERETWRGILERKHMSHHQAELSSWRSITFKLWDLRGHILCHFREFFGPLDQFQSYYVHLRFKSSIMRWTHPEVPFSYRYHWISSEEPLRRISVSTATWDASRFFLIPPTHTL